MDMIILGYKSAHKLPKSDFPLLWKHLEKRDSDRMYKEYPDMISYLVSLDDEKNITGIIGFEPCLLEDRNFFYISPLEVREKFRGQKIASSLLEEINKLSRRFKLDGLTLFCREDLVFFYSKRGFRIVASIDRDNKKEYLMVKENIIEK